jgi:hypothetical protein
VPGVKHANKPVHGIRPNHLRSIRPAKRADEDDQTVQRPPPCGRSSLSSAANLCRRVSTVRVPADGQMTVRRS